MQIHSRGVYEFIGRLAVTRPRLTVLVNLLWKSFEGVIVGLVVALLVLGFTSWTQERFWVYAFSTVLVLFLRILGQLMWLVQLRPQLPNLLSPAMEMHGLQHDENQNVPVDRSSHLSLTAVIVVTAGAATILATEDASPIWMSKFPGNILVPAVAGMIAAPLNFLVTPSYLNTLLRGHHHVAETAAPEDTP